MQFLEAQATIQRQAAELDELKAQLAARAAQSDGEAAAARELRNERDTAKQKAESAEAQLAETRALVRQRSTEAAEVSLALRDVQQRTTALGRELAVLRGQSAAQSNHVTALEAQLAVVKLEKGRREAQLAAMVRRLGDTTQVLDRTRDEARTARAECKGAQMQALTLEAALQKAEWLVGIKSSEAEENFNELNASERRVANLRRKLTQVRATSAQRKRRVTALNRQLEKANQDSALRQSDQDNRLKEESERLAQHEQSLKEVTGERDIARAQSLISQTGARVLTGVLQQEFDKNQILEAELSKARASNRDLTASISAARENAQKAQKEREDYKASTEKELVELRAHRSRTQDPTAELKAAKKELVELRGAVISAELKRDEAKRALEINRLLCSGREKTLQDQIANLQAQIRGLTDERDQARKHLTQIQARLAPR